jgi:hypothetical protein
MLFQHEAEADCPYCGETITLIVDESAGEQSYFEDCSVCCRPILITLTGEIDSESLIISVNREDD